MKQLVVGTYEIGYEQIELVLRDGTGGEFWFIPENGKIPRMKLGADETRWLGIVSNLLHESFEFALDRQRVRFKSSCDLTNNHAQYLFVFDHQQFHQACVEAGEFVTGCLPDLSRAWNAWRKAARLNARKAKKS